MCNCPKPTRNDEPCGYGVANRAPELRPSDVLIYDECGRCRPQVNGTGSTDYHSHHFRVVEVYGSAFLLVRHGGGDERVGLGGRHRRIIELLEPMDSDRRYLMLYALYSVHREATTHARAEEAEHWRRAAAEKRIKTQKVRGRDAVKVWVEAPHNTKEN